MAEQKENRPPMKSEEVTLSFGPWRLPLKAIFTALTVWYLLSILVRFQAADLDLWGYLAFGRLFWENGRFPYQDVYTYLPTRPLWVYHEWLTGVLYYPLYKWLGGWALQLLRLVVALATVGLLAATARRRGAEFWGITVTLVTASGFLAMGYAPVRAQVFTYFFFALTLYLLELSRLKQRWFLLLWLVPIQIVWCNLHGGFPAGLGLIGLYAAGELLSRRPWWPYAAILVPVTLATLINPYGWHYWTYLAEAITMPRPEITEWASIIGAWRQQIDRIAVVNFTFVLIFSFFLLYVAGKPEPFPALALAVTLLLGVKHLRHLAFFYMVAAVYLAPHMSRYLEHLRQRPGVQQFLFRAANLSWQPLRWGLLMVAAFLLIQLCRYPCWLLTVPGKPSASGAPNYYPVAAVNWLKQQDLRGNLLTTFNWGEFLLWQLYPDFRVGLDGRYETVYPAAVHRSYMDFIFARPGWEKFLAAYPPDFILLERSARIVKRLEREQGWQKIYEDEICLILAPPGATPALKTAGRY